MLQPFHGWQRTAGVVTLGLACVIVGALIRSRFTIDSLVLTLPDGMQIWISSVDGQIELMQDWIGGCEGVANPSVEVLSTSSTASAFYSLREKSPYCGIRDLALAIPLTLLATYLILWKPRKREAPSPD